MSLSSDQLQSIRVWRVNAFTTRRFTGNPAGVVPDADALSEPLMQSIAAELNDISETVFISQPTMTDADVRLRYFSATTEVDLCGHATISAAFALCWLGRVRGDQPTRSIRAQTAVGVLELGLTFEGTELAWATMEQLEPRIARAPGAARAASVLGLPETALAPDLEVACCTTGLWACFVPLADVAQLSRIQIDREAIRQLWPDNEELSGVYAFAFEDERTTRGRFFSPPKYGIVEDPVTGTASGALGAYLIANGRMPKDGELVARQGVEMGRPGRVRVRQNPNGRMAISGQAVPVIRGDMLI